MEVKLRRDFHTQTMVAVTIISKVRKKTLIKSGIEIIKNGQEYMTF